MQHCHFIGIGGIGMSGLARILLKKNIKVTGSDLSSNYVTEGLSKEGAQVFIGHSAKYVTPSTTVIYSTDIKPENPEYQAALSLECPMLHRSELLSQLMSGYRTLAVAGTHGKTTTSALLATVLAFEGLDPSYAVGGIIKQWQSNAEHGYGNYFVAEADESDGSFLKYKPYGAIITNIDFDHMDYYKTEDALKQAFRKFASQVVPSDNLFWCGEDSRLKSLNLPGVSYGFSSQCSLRAVNIVQNGWSTLFDIEYKGRRYYHIKLSLIGRHNVLNALGVFGLALASTVHEDHLRDAFDAFKGVSRRCDKRGEIDGILLIDDYAHHPTEVKTTLEGIRLAIGERRLIAIFQPHRYTRTKDCLGTYAGIFDSADEVIVTDIYGAGEAPIEGVTSDAVLSEIKKCSSISCRYLPRKNLASALGEILLPQDVVVTLGAGDITKLSSEYLSWKKAN